MVGLESCLGGLESMFTQSKYIINFKRVTLQRGLVGKKRSLHFRLIDFEYHTCEEKRSYIGGMTLTHRRVFVLGT